MSGISIELVGDKLDGHIVNVDKKTKYIRIIVTSKNYDTQIPFLYVFMDTKDNKHRYKFIKREAEVASKVK